MFKTIVVGTDGSHRAETAVDAAISLASLTGATLHIVHAHDEVSASYVGAVESGVMPIDVNETNDAIRARAQEICDAVLARCTSAGVTAESHSMAGDAGDALIEVAKEADADLLVVGNRGMTGKRRFVWGSVPNKVSHHCPTNLLIVDTAD